MGALEHLLDFPSGGGRRIVVSRDECRNNPLYLAALPAGAGEPEGLGCRRLTCEGCHHAMEALGVDGAGGAR